MTNHTRTGSFALFFAAIALGSLTTGCGPSHGS